MYCTVVVFLTLAGRDPSATVTFCFGGRFAPVDGVTLVCFVNGVMRSGDGVAFLFRDASIVVFAMLSIALRNQKA